MSTGRDVTERLAGFLARSHWEEVPALLRHEAKRTLLNHLGAVARPST
jgi:hypothetical protein